MVQFSKIPKDFNSISEFLSLLNRIGLTTYQPNSEIICIRLNLFSKSLKNDRHYLDRKNEGYEFSIYGISENILQKPDKERKEFFLADNQFYNEKPDFYPGYLPNEIFQFDSNVNMESEYDYYTNIIYKDSFDLIKYLQSLPLLKNSIIHENGPIGYDITICSGQKYPNLKFPKFDFREYLNFKKYGNDYIEHLKKKKIKEADEKHELQEQAEFLSNLPPDPHVDPNPDRTNEDEEILNKLIDEENEKVFNNDIFAFYCLNNFDIYKNYKSVLCGSACYGDANWNYIWCKPSDDYASLFLNKKFQEHLQTFEKDRSEFLTWIDFLRKNNIQRRSFDVIDL